MKKDGSLQSGAFEKWISWVDNQENGAADEQIFGVQLFSLTPELATVWAPFVIYYKGKLAGCGVNQFTLAKSADGWKIIYGIDKPTAEDCDAYRNTFKE